MLPPFDIFRVAPDGQLIWRAAAENLERAQQRIQLLMHAEPGDFVIYSQKTGHKTIVPATGPEQRLSESSD